MNDTTLNSSNTSSNTFSESQWKSDYIIDGDDLVSLRVAMKELLNELQFFVQSENTDSPLNVYRKRRIAELKQILERTDWDKVKLHKYVYKENS